MDITDRIKPISYLKSHTTEIVRQFDEEDTGPMIITQNGEAKMVVISIKSYKEAIEQRKLNEERMSFMKLLALGTKEIAEGKFVSEDDFLDEMDRDE
ncbi:type II toxin-antitoxin system prevent-host-death family antitoxin [Massilia sp. CCM 8733]|uniref:Antitoxin n=1 Tax=Massilia mucilaginosa TaxID=2609282 RepID=A0ABX0NMU9_9BURK|nr:type II toxin-antitoxin system Phd/YefM family antitoxin [Massilia mucilaginosa]NHZ88143.1 type II toxin-antitoxin system prevent-host-death family antitoxin [Massilia mucilaginosa]